ncbi:MAG TPA: cupin domain-containing protein [Thermoanaerobaculia bacterium]
MNRLWRFAVVGFVLTLAAALYTAQGQQAAPTETKGVSQKLLGAVDLGGEIEGMAGRQLRVRQVTLAPGAVFAVHNHKDRPGVAYVLQGTITEHRGDATKDYTAGEVWTETKDTTHWIENRGKVDAVLIPADIFKTQQ